MPTDLIPVIRRNLKQTIKNKSVSQILKSLNDKHLPLPSSQITSERDSNRLPTILWCDGRWLMWFLYHLISETKWCENRSHAQNRATFPEHVNGTRAITNSDVRRMRREKCCQFYDWCAPSIGKWLRAERAHIQMCNKWNEIENKNWCVLDILLLRESIRRLVGATPLYTCNRHTHSVLILWQTVVV